MYAAIRQGKAKTGMAEELARRIKEGAIPIISDVEGFMAYYVVYAPDDTVTAISIFNDYAGRKSRIGTGGAEYARGQSAGRRAVRGYPQFGTPAAWADAEQPRLAAREYLRFLGELGRIATGGSELLFPDAKDKRFADPAWKDSAIYRALAQCYLAWGGALNHFVDEAKMNKRDARTRTLHICISLDRRDGADQFNFGQSGCSKGILDKGREVFMRGLGNLTRDLARNGGSRHKSTKINLRWAKPREEQLPGAVAYRSPVLELIQIIGRSTTRSIGAHCSSSRHRSTNFMYSTLCPRRALSSSP